MRVGLRSVVVGVVAALSAALALAPAAGAAEPAGAAFGASPAPGRGVPNGRAYEEVTAADKYGGEAGYAVGVEKYNRPPLYSVASPSGLSVLFTENGAFGETQSGLDMYGVARYTPGSGWSTTAALPPVVKSPTAVDDLPIDFYPSRELDRFLWTAEKPYVSGANAISKAGPDQTGSPNLYLSAEGAGLSSTLEPQWISRPTVAAIEPALGAMPVATSLSIAGASDNLSRVYFGYEGTLTELDAPRVDNVKDKARGFYEWAEGRLHQAGTLPNGQLDAYGAEPAAAKATEGVVGPEQYDNQVAANGTEAFFLSPGRETETLKACKSAAEAGETIVGGCVPELYVRIHEGGTTRVVLVSRDELTEGAPAPVAPSEFLSPDTQGIYTTMYASPDGKHVFFVDEAALTREALEAEEAGEAPTSKAYELDLAAGGEGKLVYRPAMNLEHRGHILGMSANGSRVLYMQEQNSPFSLELWEQTANGEEVVTPIAETSRAMTTESMRVSRSGDAFVFSTSFSLTSLTAPQTTFNAPSNYTEVYRYVPGAKGGSLSCLSCLGTSAPTGDARLSNDNAEIDALRIPQSRGINAEATQVFFDTPEALVPQDVNHTRDVYEWQAPGTGGCSPEDVNGCVYLVSSGTSPQESFLLSNGENGENLFFATTSALSPEDREGGYDVYDARVGGHAATVSEEAAGCGGECEKPPAGGPAAPSAITEVAGPSGNLPAPPAPVRRKAGNAKRPGSHARAKARRRKLARCRRHARRRRGRHRRKLALRRCRRRFGAKAARRHHGHRRGHHAHGPEHGHAHGKRRRG